MKYNKHILFLGALCLFVSTNTLGKDLIDISSLPAWFQEAMAREVKVDSSSKIEISELNIDYEVRGKAKLVEKADTYWYFSIDIGAGTPVECYIFTEFDGPANSLAYIVDGTIPQIEKLNNKKLANRYTYAAGTGVIGKGTPYLILDTLYILGEGKNKVTGIVKALSATTNNTLEICVHNELGYRAAFLDVFSSFLGAVKASHDTSNFYEVIYELGFNDMFVGYVYEQHSLDEDGDVYTVLEEAMLLPLDGSALATTDSKTEEFGSIDGALINTYKYTIENGVMVSEFSLRYSEEKWQVSGQAQSKELGGSLEHDGWLLTSFGNYLAISDLLAIEDLNAQYVMWLSDVNPLQATTVSFTQLEDNEVANMQLDLGSVIMTFSAQIDGTFSKANIKQDSMDIILRSSYSKGSPIIE